MTSQIQTLSIQDLNAIPLTNTISFNYLRPTDVKVEVGTVLTSLTQKTYLTHWSITNDNQIKFESSAFTSTGTYHVKIYRQTDATTPTHVFVAGSSIRAEDLNNINKQTLFVAEELRDILNGLALDGTGLNSSLLVHGSNLADNSVTTTKIDDGAVGTADLSPGAVTAEKIGDGQITETKLADNSVMTRAIGDNQVTTSKLADRSVTAPKLADNAVTTRAILDGEITRPKIAPGNITDVELATTLSQSAAIPGRSGQFTAPLITVNDQGRVTAIQDAVIPSSSISNGAVTLEKISTAAQNSLTAAAVAAAAAAATSPIKQVKEATSTSSTHESETFENTNLSLTINVSANSRVLVIASGILHTASAFGDMGYVKCIKDTTSTDKLFDQVIHSYDGYRYPAANSNNPTYPEAIFNYYLYDSANGAGNRTYRLQVRRENGRAAYLDDSKLLAIEIGITT